MDGKFADIFGFDKVQAIKATLGFPENLLVFGMSENSDLVSCPTQATADFFRHVFTPAGPYWQAYERFGFGTRPPVPYLHFFAGRMYFLKNLEQRNIFGAGIGKKYEKVNSGKRGGTNTASAEGNRGGNCEKFELRTSFSPESLLMILSSPFDFCRLAASTALLALNTPLVLADFEKHACESRAFLKQNVNKKEFDLSIFDSSIAGALASLSFSFFATLSYSFNLKLPSSPTWEKCEAEELSNMLEKDGMPKLGNSQNFNLVQKPPDIPFEIIGRFGFHSQNIYELSEARIAEKPPAMQEISLPAVPKNPHWRLRENAKFCLARHFLVSRRQLLALGRQSGLDELIFHLTFDEIRRLACGERQNELKETAAKRKAGHDYLRSLGASALPSQFAYDARKGSWIGDFAYDFSTDANNHNSTGRGSGNTLAGVSVGGGGTCQGVCVFVCKKEDYAKDVSGKIIASDSFSPDLTLLYKKAIGVVSKTGGKLAHSAIIAREMNLPCIVQVRNFDRLAEGMKLRLEGKTGIVEIIG
ncbi:hypothetical protein FJZ26_00690 [Candidatus Parvarchaeota archaeon]|nr:hypothetical protein [Candidatus Parvarchaeota archaeon]